MSGCGILDTSTVLRLAEVEPGDLPDEALIAATALAHDLPVYTFNPADFHGIDGLAVVPLP